MKNKVKILWILFGICLVVTIGLWFGVKKSNPKYEEVTVTVISAEEKKIKNKKNGSTYTQYEVKVNYEGKTYNLGNAHSVYAYPKGKNVKAYFSNGKMFANIEGVKSGSTVGTLYSVFLIGSLILFFVNLIETSKLSQEKRKVENEI